MIGAQNTYSALNQEILSVQELLQSSISESY